MSEPEPSVAKGPYESVLAVLTLGERDEATLRHAARLADSHGARLSALAVADQADALTRMAEHAKVPPSELVRWRTEALAEGLRGVFTSAGLPEVETSVRIGKPFLEVIRTVESGGHDLVVKAAERVEGVGGYLFRSTDQHLVRKCPAPVLLNVPSEQTASGPVVAAIDADEDHASDPAAQAELNERIIALARAVSETLRVPSLVLTAWDAPAEAVARRWFNDESNVTDYVRSVERERRSALKQIVERAPVRSGQTPQTLLERGAARTVIPQLVAQRHASLLVIGTVARTGLSGFLIGNTAEDVLNAVTCSILAVKPHGFVSPVH